MANIVKTILVRIVASTSNFVNSMRMSRESLNKYTEAGRKSAYASTRFRMALEKMMYSFSMWALGLMFFGMAIQRFTMNAAKAATAMFTKVMESANIQGTAVQRLSAHWDYFKFVLGSVLNRYLEPLMPRIIELVNTITKWMNENEKLVGGLAKWGIIVGTVFFLVGTLTLGIKSLIAALIVGGKGLVYFSVGLYYIGVGAVWTAKQIWKLLAVVGSTTWAAGILGIIAAIITLILLLGYKWDWNWRAMLAQSIIWGLKLLKFFGWLFEQIHNIMIDAIALAVKGIFKLFDKMVNYLVGKLQAIVSWFNKIAKKLGYEGIEIDFTRFTSGEALQSALDAIDDVAEGAKIHGDKDSWLNQLIADWEDALTKFVGKGKETPLDFLFTQPPSQQIPPQTEEAESYPGFIPPQQTITIQEVNITAKDDLKVQKLIDELRAYLPSGA